MDSLGVAEGVPLRHFEGYWGHRGRVASLGQLSGHAGAQEAVRGAAVEVRLRYLPCKQDLSGEHSSRFYSAN